MAEECVDILANEVASGGGIWPVDVFPWLKYMPLWMPGAGFKKKAQVWKKKMEDFVDRPYEYVKNSMVSVRLLKRIYSLKVIMAEIGQLQTVVLFDPP